MKSFKEYLTESKKVYEFRIKVAGNHAKDAVAQIKASLAEFHVATVSSGRTTPIQERQSEFPEHKNTQMTVYEITTEYPATALQIRDRIASGLGTTHNCIKIRSMAEEKEYELNHENDQRTGEALVGKIQDPSDNSDLASEKQKMNFLKELNKDKHQGTQYKGVNDKLLADSIPGLAPEYRKVKDVTVDKGTTSAIGTKQNKIPNPYKGV
jgi:hypothetical protein